MDSLAAEVLRLMARLREKAGQCDTTPEGRATARTLVEVESELGALVGNRETADFETKLGELAGCLVNDLRQARSANDMNPSELAITKSVETFAEGVQELAA
jgi:molybdopterin converting factor small subunit